MKTSTPEQLRAAFRSAPPEIREAYMDERLVQILLELQNRYQLHIDIAGAIKDQLGDLLLGLITPAEFYGNLVLLGTTDQTAKSIMDDLNKQIFIPLREKMRARADSEDDVPVPDYSTPKTPAFMSAAQTPVSSAPITPNPVSTPQTPTPTPVPVVEMSSPDPITVPQIRTMAHDMTAAKNHEGAHAPIPSAWTAAPAQPPIQEAFPATPKPPIEPVVQQPPIEKTYGVDPYREPVQ